MDHPTMRIVLDGAPVNLAHDAVQALLDALSARATNAEAECAVLRAREPHWHTARTTPSWLEDLDDDLLEEVKDAEIAELKKMNERLRESLNQPSEHPPPSQWGPNHETYMIEEQEAETQARIEDIQRICSRQGFELSTAKERIQDLEEVVIIHNMELANYKDLVADRDAQIAMLQFAISQLARPSTLPVTEVVERIRLGAFGHDAPDDAALTLMADGHATPRAGSPVPSVLSYLTAPSSSASSVSGVDDDGGARSSAVSTRAGTPSVWSLASGSGAESDGSLGSFALASAPGSVDGSGPFGPPAPRAATAASDSEQYEWSSTGGSVRGSPAPVLDSDSDFDTDFDFDAGSEAEAEAGAHDSFEDAIDGLGVVPAAGAESAPEGLGMASTQPGDADGLPVVRAHILAAVQAMLATEQIDVTSDLRQTLAVETADEEHAAMDTGEESEGGWEEAFAPQG